jgi:hypothetical protein
MSAVQELAVTRQRLDTLERLLADKNIIARVEIEQFTPSREAAAERALWVQEYLTRILRIVQQEGEAVEALNKGDRTSEELAQEFAAAAN